MRAADIQLARYRVAWRPTRTERRAVAVGGECGSEVGSEQGWQTAKSKGGHFAVKNARRRTLHRAVHAER